MCVPSSGGNWRRVWVEKVLKLVWPKVTSWGLISCEDQAQKETVVSFRVDSFHIERNCSPNVSDHRTQEKMLKALEKFERFQYKTEWWLPFYLQYLAKHTGTLVLGILKLVGRLEPIGLFYWFLLNLELKCQIRVFYTSDLFMLKD